MVAKGTKSVTVRFEKLTHIMRGNGTNFMLPKEILTQYSDGS